MACAAGAPSPSTIGLGVQVDGSIHLLRELRRVGGVAGRGGSPSAACAPPGESSELVEILKRMEALWKRQTAAECSRHPRAIARRAL
jgi:hypothetical protein